MDYFPLTTNIYPNYTIYEVIILFNEAILDYGAVENLSRIITFK